MAAFVFRSNIARSPVHPFVHAVAVVVAAWMLVGCAGKVEEQEGATPRVVSLAPSLTEMVYAVGGGEYLVGRTTACNYPAEVKQVTAVGGFGTPSLERLVSVSPTVVLATDLADKSMIRRMEDLGLRYEQIPCRSVDDFLLGIKKVGMLLGRDREAAELYERLSGEIAGYRHGSAEPTERPQVYAELWHDPVMTAGRESYVSELISLAGGRNIGDAAGRDYFKISPEWVVTENPDIVLCLYMGKGKSAREALMSRPGWGEIKALQTGRVYDGLGDDKILRPSPRLLEGIQSLQECFRETP